MRAFVVFGILAVAIALIVYEHALAAAALSIIALGLILTHRN